ncbi:Type IV secretion [Gluconobacter sp. Dm-44]|uniref:Type IV secretion n=1 Tax=Gluconobacter sp. Dm-44 TaxID=2799805 RepID=UPI001B8D2965|nr:Type IV secretion [Gluconobacter sp. Dm-44]MBS1061159.1 Type IV secretion [Gluconobacter sp. Dm-44]
MSVSTVLAGDLCPLICPVGNAILDANGSLIAAIELPGIDPDSLLPEDLRRMSVIAASIYSTVPTNMTVQQYYVHAQNCGVSLRARPDSPVSNELSHARQEALNEKGLAQSRLVHVLVLEDPEATKSGLISSLIRQGPFALFDSDAREQVKQRFSAIGQILLREREINKRLRELERACEDARKKWAMAMGSARRMPVDQLWTFAKFLGTMNTRYLRFGNYIPVPEDDLDAVLLDGDVTTVDYHGAEMLMLHGLAPNYCVSMGLVKTPENPIGMWTRGKDHSPIAQSGNYIININFSPLSPIKRYLLFQNAKNSLSRQQIDVRSLFKGQPTSEAERQATETYEIKVQQEALEKASSLDERFGTISGQIVIFGDHPDQVIADAEKMTTAMEATQARLVWEKNGLPNAFKTLQIGGYRTSDRTSVGTESRFGAVSLYAAPAIGTPEVEDLGNEEAQYIFETVDGNPYYYSSYAGGKAFTFAIGPTGSGKTFFKNTITSHFLKYGGFVRSLDIDAGTEPLAHAFGNDGGIIRLGEDDASGHPRGIDPFVSFAGDGSTAFTSHIIDLCRLLLDVNDNDETRILTGREQQTLDEAIIATLEITDPNLRTFRHMLAHLPESLKYKFGRWMTGGVYDGIFNARQDGMGDSSKKIGVINLNKFKETPKIIKPVLLDLFYRVTMLFEDPAMRMLPKQLDVDEAHLPLSVPGFAERITTKARTWRKHMAGITMWTQGADDFANLPDWNVLRGAATQFIFMADPRMDDALYQSTFKITPGVTQMIRTLTPREEAVIVQPDLGIAKKVRLSVEPEQYVINTSHPREAADRDRLMREYGPAEGLRAAVERHKRGKLGTGEKAA